MRWSFGATRVGGLLARVRMHLATERFLAERRRDAVWEAGCDYAGLALGRLMSRIKGRGRAARLPRPAARGRAAWAAAVRAPAARTGRGRAG